ncbi:MAG: class I SAM-dependent methyltransferase [Polyangiaceae bacterium]
MATAGERTIADFGEQWTRFVDNDGYYGSLELFRDLISPLLSLEDFRNQRVADLGSGTGRIVNMLLRAGAAHVTAVEPSAAVRALRENIAWATDRVDVVEATADRLPASPTLDLVVSFGVLHHIPDPAPVMRAAYRALRPGGRMLAWLYGHEGNRLYLSVVLPLRQLTRRIPDEWVLRLCRAIQPPLDAYIAACRIAPLPMRKYMSGHLGKLAPQARLLTVYDQLNPAYARYYREAEARALFTAAGFADVRLHHRHGYSWSVVGTKVG